MNFNSKAVSSSVSFKYDPFGRRIYKSSTAGTSIYAYDGANIVEETNSSGAAVARYVQTKNVDEPLAILRSGATSYYEQDGLGSVTSLTNAAGTVAQTYTYDSFGNLIASTGSLINNFRYTGREFDTETGLYFYRARFYDPAAGRFVREDPAGFEAGLNFYRYAVNNPINFNDPFGLCPPSLKDRLALGFKGVVNLGIGVAKVAGGSAATAGTGGLAVG
ncbi:MAG: RHS repeat-associated core domain-containing protein, partial [Candidatus Acidiferrum sp.]